MDAIALGADPQNYVDVAIKVASKCAQKQAFGILMCGNGIGMSIVANKFKGIYAARCLTEKDALDAKIINNANILCLSAAVNIEENIQIVKTFFETEYTGRKIERLELIRNIETQFFSD